MYAQSCPTLCNPVDCSLPGSFVHGISQQESWRGLPSAPPEDPPYPGTKRSPEAPAAAVGLFTTEPPKCPSVDQWMKMWYNRILLNHRRGEMGLFVEMQIDLESVIEWNKSKREKQISSINTYMWNLEKWYWWTSLQGRDRDTKNGHVATEGEGGTNQEVGITMQTLLVLSRPDPKEPASGPEETWRLQPREAAGRPQAGLNLKFNSEPTPQNSWSSTRFSPKLSPKRLLLPNVNSLQATFPLSSPTKTGHSSSGAHPGIHTRQSRKDKVLSGPSWSVRSVLGKAQVLSII